MDELQGGWLARLLGRAQAEQAAAAMENMAQGASAAELLSRTEVRPDNALGQIMGGVANG